MITSGLPGSPGNEAGPVIPIHGTGNVPALQASGFTMFPINEYNPLVPILPSDRPIYDGGQYFDGYPVTSGAAIIWDGGTYLNGGIVGPPVFRPSINGGVY